jgi:cobalt-zinc-cadmium efflux system protein
VLLSIWVIYEAFLRWQSPPAINGVVMGAIALGGLLVNIIAAKLLHGDHKHDLNIRGAWLHVMGDMLGSVAAVAAALLIATLGLLWADPLTSVLISLIIIYGAWRLIVESVNVLLEEHPRTLASWRSNR